MNGVDGSEADGKGSGELDRNADDLDSAAENSAAPQFLSLETALEAEAARARYWLDCLVLELAGEGADLGVGFCTDSEMTEVNARYRGKERPTDVLSFPNREDDKVEDEVEVAAEEDGFYVGDVLISIDTARRQALEAEQPLAWEVQCLLLHGLLHCLGHDHETDQGQMDQLELDLRERWIGDGQETWAVPNDATAPTGRLAMDGGGQFGRVALIGRPNAGKSTLMNRWVGEKVAIVSDKPQTTRHRIVGLLTDARGQIAFLDTPGIHKPAHRLNRRMVKAATAALAEADVICLLVDASVTVGGGDRYVRELVAERKQPKMVLLNKIDLVRKGRLLPLIEQYAAAGFDPVVPISALDGDGADRALEELWKLIPEGVPQYDPELLTLQTQRFLAAERIREKVLQQTRDEIPFVIAVRIDEWTSREDGVALIAASLLVERESQKSIIIGKGGHQIKAIGTAARVDLEEFLGTKVFLDLVVRTERGWREDPRAVGRLENYEMA